MPKMPKMPNKNALIQKFLRWTEGKVCNSTELSPQREWGADAQTYFQVVVELFDSSGPQSVALTERETEVRGFLGGSRYNYDEILQELKRKENWAAQQGAAEDARKKAEVGKEQERVDKERLEKLKEAVARKEAAAQRKLADEKSREEERRRAEQARRKKKEQQRRLEEQKVKTKTRGGAEQHPVCVQNKLREILALRVPNAAVKEVNIVICKTAYKFIGECSEEDYSRIVDFASLAYLRICQDRAMQLRFPNVAPSELSSRFNKQSPEFSQRYYSFSKEYPNEAAEGLTVLEEILSQCSQGKRDFFLLTQGVAVQGGLKLLLGYQAELTDSNRQISGAGSHSAAAAPTAFTLFRASGAASASVSTEAQMPVSSVVGSRPYHYP